MREDIDKRKSIIAFGEDIIIFESLHTIAFTMALFSLSSRRSRRRKTTPRRLCELDVTDLSV